jgi:hypothetical protein
MNCHDQQSKIQMDDPAGSGITGQQYCFGIFLVFKEQETRLQENGRGKIHVFLQRFGIGFHSD